MKTVACLSLVILIAIAALISLIALEIYEYAIRHYRKFNLIADSFLLRIGIYRS